MSRCRRRRRFPVRPFWFLLVRGPLGGRRGLLEVRRRPSVSTERLGRERPGRSRDAALGGAGESMGACTSPAFSGALGVKCNQLVDSEGRDVLLHGVNARVEGLFDVTFTDGRLPLQTIPVFTQTGRQPDSLGRLQRAPRRGELERDRADRDLGLPRAARARRGHADVQRRRRVRAHRFSPGRLLEGDRLRWRAALGDHPAAGRCSSAARWFGRPFRQGTQVQNAYTTFFGEGGRGGDYSSGPAPSGVVLRRWRRPSRRAWPPIRR